MVQSELVLPQIVPGTNIKKCQKKRGRPNKKAPRTNNSQVRTNLPTTSLTQVKGGSKKNNGSHSILPSCFSSLYKTSQNSGAKNEGVASRHVLPPPTSLPSLPTAAASSKPILASHHPLGTGVKSTSALSNNHLPKLKLTHHLASGKNGESVERPYVSNFTLKGTNVNHNGIKTTTSTLNNETKPTEDSVHSIESLQSELKLNLPHNIERFQTGADMCSIINLCMPLPSKLRTSKDDNSHSQEFVRSETPIKENKTLIQSVNDTMIKCDHNNEDDCSAVALGISSLTSSKLPSTGQLDHFNSALIQLKRVVSDSTHQKKKEQSKATMKHTKMGEKSAPALTTTTTNATTDSPLKIERQNERHLNIIDLEKQTNLLVKSTTEDETHRGLSGRPLTHRTNTTPRGMVCLNKGSLLSPKRQPRYKQVKNSPRESKKEPSKGCPSEHVSSNKTRSYSEKEDYKRGHLQFTVYEERKEIHHQLTTQHLGKRDINDTDDKKQSIITTTDTRHSIHHAVHCISLPNDNEEMITTTTESPTTIGLTKKKYLESYTPTGSGYHRAKSSRPSKNQFQHMTPFAYYHMLRQTNQASNSATKRSGSVPPPSLVPPPTHPPLQSAGSRQLKRPNMVSFHHSVRSDLTIEGNRGIGGDANKTTLPQLVLKGLDKLTPQNSPVVTPCSSFRRQKQYQTSLVKLDNRKGSSLYLDPFNGANSRYKWKVNRLQDKENLSIKKEKKATK